MNDFELFICNGSHKSFVLCRGEVDITTAGKLREALELCLENDAPLLCVDGCGITFFSSSGVEVLIDAVDWCYERGVELELALSEEAERVVRALAVGRRSGYSKRRHLWCGNLLNAGPLTRTRFRPLVSWRVHCPVCGRESVHDRCDHDASFTADVEVEEVLAEVLRLHKETSGSRDADLLL